MMDETKSRIIKLVKGQELNIHISDDICCPQSFMYPACHQAAQALKRIVEQNRYFHQTSEYVSEAELTDNLFQYSSNVIMFDAPRGGGKTQTMLSFSHILSESGRMPSRECRYAPHETKSGVFLEDHELSECRFLTLAPVETAALEGDQNILYVVLSRLFSYAQSLLQDDRNVYVKEQNRSALYEALQRCLSGINGIKHPQKDALDGITSLMDISDGAVLRKYFYNLVQQILKIAAPLDGTKNSFLVLQLDDADSQINCGYQVLEDVRKYLVIPNLVILISADVDMLYYVILQGHYAKFSNLLGANNASLPGELSKTCRKYIDKLIPPSHMVHLPQIDKYIEVNGNRLDLKYVQYKDGRISQEETVKDWPDGDGWNLQNIVLMLIYRKTGVVFVAPSRYLHNIIPRTLRGLNQLVFLLSEMDDIPKIDVESINSIPEFAEAMQKQIGVAEGNLSRFVDYFTHEWIGAKIKNQEDRVFLKEFCKTVGVNRVRLAMGHLQKQYKDVKSEELRDDRLKLDTLMANLENTHRSEDDFLLFFSIRTLFSLESHRMVLLRKKETIRTFLEKYRADIEKAKGGSDYSNIPPIVFDFNPDQMCLPKSLLPSEAVKKGILGEFKPTGELETYVSLIKEMGKYEDLSDEQKKVCETFRIKNGTHFSLVKEMVNKGFAVPFASDSCYPTVISAAWDIVKKGSSNSEGLIFFGNTMVNRKEDGTYTMNCLNLITFMLQMGNDSLGAGKKDITPEELMEQQRYFYKIQETALLVAANWDIQGQIQKRLTAETSESDSMKKLEALYGGVDTIIKKINSGKFRKYIDRISDGKDCNKEYRLSVEKAFDNLFVKPKVTLSVTDAHLSALFGMMFGDTESSPGDSVPEPEAGSGPASLQQQGSSSNQ